MWKFSVGTLVALILMGCTKSPEPSTSATAPATPSTAIKKVPSEEPFPIAEKPTDGANVFKWHWRHKNADQDVIQADSPVDFTMCNQSDPSGSDEVLKVSVRTTCASAWETVPITKSSCVHFYRSSLRILSADNPSPTLDKNGWITYTSPFTFPLLTDTAGNYTVSGEGPFQPVINSSASRTPYRLCKDNPTQVANFDITEGACSSGRVSTAYCADVVARTIVLPKQANPNLSIGITGGWTRGN